MTNEVNINMPKMVKKPEIIKINDTCFISVTEYVKRLERFYDVIFNNNGKETFIGRFPKDDSVFKVLYNNGMILVAGVDFINEVESAEITKVYLLYDILDDVVYSVNEVAALKTFDPTINSDHIKNKETLIIRSDIEKRYRLSKSKK